MIKKIFIFFFVFSAFLFFAKASLAATYHVRVDGNDATCNGLSNASAAAAPNCSFRTIQKGIDKAIAAGDTLSIQAGNYDEKLTTKAGGASGNYITLIAVGGYARVLYIGIEHNYIIIDGFEVTGNSGQNHCVRINRVNTSTPIEYVTIRNCYFHDSPTTTFTIASYLNPHPNYITIDRNIFGSGLYLGIAVNGNPAAPSHHWTITNNTWNKFAGDSIRLYGRDHYVAGNTMKFSQSEPSGSHTDVFFQSDSDPSHVLYDTVLENNKIMYSRAQIGNLSDDGTHSVYNLTFRNNIFYAVSSPFNFSAVSSAWYNNTFAFSSQTSTNHPLLAWGQGFNNLIFKNNIFYANSGPNSSYGYYSTPTGKTITSSNNLYSKYSPNYVGFTARANETGVQNGVDPKFKNAPKVATYAVWRPAYADYDMEYSTNAKWLNCDTTNCGSGAIAPTINSKDSSVLHGGAQSLHVAGNTNAGVYRTAGWTSNARYTVSAWVYVVSGSVRLKAHLGGINNYTTLATTSTTGRWIQLSGSFSSDSWGMSGSPIIVDAASNGAEWYLDDVVLSVDKNSTNSLQYWKEYENFFMVGEYIEIDDDGIARKITSKDTSTNSITFSPALAAAPNEMLTVIECWGTNNSNLTLDLSPLNISSPLYDKGISLSSVWTNAKDILGVLRPQGSNWDIGAFEYASGASLDTTPPASPSGITIN